MPTTFNVFSLGNFASIDPTEGNTLAENADSLEGFVFGGVGNPLLLNAVELSPSGAGFSGGSTTAYDQNNNVSNDTFSIDGGPAQTFDAAVAFEATITYVDGTTADISAVIFQDTAGNTYFAPEFSSNPDQAALEAAAVRSLELGDLLIGSASGLAGDRQTWNFMMCYVSGTQIETPSGVTPIENLRVGDFVKTRDNGSQEIRWIGKSTVQSKEKLAPVRILKGALGGNIPSRDLLVSRQHRMLVASRVCERMFDETEILVPAIKLTALPGIYVDKSAQTVTYYHLMTDAHEVIYAEDAPSETFLSGPNAIEALGPDAIEELRAIFPDVMTEIPTPARPIPQNRRIKTLVARHQRNNIPVLQNGI